MVEVIYSATMVFAGSIFVVPGVDIDSKSYLWPDETIARCWHDTNCTFIYSFSFKPLIFNQSINCKLFVLYYILYNKANSFYMFMVVCIIYFPLVF